MALLVARLDLEAGRRRAVREGVQVLRDPCLAHEKPATSSVSRGVATAGQAFASATRLMRDSSPWTLAAMPRKCG